MRWGGKLLKIKSNIHDDSNIYNRIADNFTDYFYYSQDGSVAERHDDINTVKYFTRLGGELLACDNGGTPYFYIQNIRGDVMMLVGADGVVKSVRDYDASGQMLSKAPGHIDRDPFGFTGGLDAGNGLWKLGARFYDSSKSAFIQQDRYMGDPSDPLSLNRYVYCGLDPVNFVDPTGFNADALRMGLGIAGGAGATIAMLTGVGEIAIGVGLIAVGTYYLGKNISDMIMEAKGVNQVNDQVSKGKAPKSVDRADKGKIKGEQDHIHLKDGSALNKNGTWKHGGRNLTNQEKDWLTENGWELPKE